MKEIGTAEKEDAISKGIVVLFCFFVCVAVSAIVIWFFVSHEIVSTPADQILVHSRAGVPYNVAPEPVERAIFLTLAALSPAALVAYFWLSGLATSSGRRTHSAQKKPSIHWQSILVASLFILPFVSSDFVELLFFPTVWAKSNKSIIVMCGAMVSLAVAYHSQTYEGSVKRISLVVWWSIALIAIALQILSYRVSSINSVTLSQSWSVHVDAALYALNQVVHGRTIIADLPSQYGFFPEIIAPVFKAIGLSVFSMTVFFAGLHAAGLVFIGILLRRHVHNPLLSILIFLVVSIPMSLFMYLNGSVQDIYIQYFPIRFFWPAIALLLFSLYSSKQSKMLFCGLGVVSGFAVFWNIDTGIPALISIGATILVKPLITKRPAFHGVGSAALFGSIAISTIAACFFALRIKAGIPLDLSEAFAAQKIFYMTGFGMIPMPVSLDPWQAVLVIYAAGAIAALSGWQRDPKNSVYDVLLCSAIMGLGLFVYYQGRSHVNCLILVSWPAILIGGVMTDLVLRAVRNRSVNMASASLAIPFLFFVSLGAITFIASSKDMAKDAIRNMSTLDVARDPVVADELRFMRETYRGRACLILSQRQAIYSAELNIASPLNGPGIAETLLQRDLDKLVRSALTSPLECIYLGVTEGSITFIDVNDSALMAKYPVISRNPLGTMMLLEPSSAVSP
ncbi:hypothetical protein PMI21_01062 [Pseudomonas sp. GM18]|uniref:hypothetical protein n=1 Tax=Pseudomonas sp. GM18 TaxID=1144324 RepID=UPI000272603C|nr:hypothetical protein [Pseudomonas sp. GM18]EJM20160.1 hypothetical protein PMI21_01062 [Pseudomonas sp. GM18]